jgi:hypothetical protein
MTNQTQKCSARLQPRARVGLHDLKRSHYDYVWNLANEIATPRQVGARNDMGGYYPMLRTYKVSPIYLN